ncbi:hypothetical protein EK21DRAFT_92602 [Setomelanomma holmii]|uniref:Uncharacterized protein n=1 Tax=Setomelanomma holmii TaxID=210430 RepID=A0A9P4LIG1_9PLEO|nr:hypothetical protein EK21DRAFT_92602 [Setomelanomma holmii]
MFESATMPPASSETSAESRSFYQSDRVQPWYRSHPLPSIDAHTKASPQTPSQVPSARQLNHDPFRILSAEDQNSACTEDFHQDTELDPSVYESFATWPWRIDDAYANADSVVDWFSEDSCHSLNDLLGREVHNNDDEQYVLPQELERFSSGNTNFDSRLEQLFDVDALDCLNAECSQEVTPNAHFLSEPTQITNGHLIEADCNIYVEVSRKRQSRLQVGSSACHEWLHKHGLTVYPSNDQLKQLAASDGKTTKQTRISLNNLRNRVKSTRRIIPTSQGPYTIFDCRDENLEPNIQCVANLTLRIYTQCEPWARTISHPE